MGHSKLLSKAENKYELVLEVARRAKIIKDEIGKTAVSDTMKPIPSAIQDMMGGNLYAVRPQAAVDTLEPEMTEENVDIQDFEQAMQPEVAETSEEAEEAEEA